MNAEVITKIEQEMQSILNNAQMKQLNKVLQNAFYKIEVKKSEIVNIVDKEEDYIIKSPVRRIHKVKSGKKVKESMQW